MKTTATLLFLVFTNSVLAQFEITFPDDPYTVWCEIQPPTVEFRVTVGLKGWVGLGISRNPGMTDSDIFIGGITDDKEPYYDDYHGLRNGTPQKDERNDWNLIVEESWENDTATHLTFTRLLNTNDDEDIEIKDEEIYFIFAYGATDEIYNHGGARGYRQMNIYNEGMSTATPPSTTTAITETTTTGPTETTTRPSETTTGPSETTTTATRTTTSGSAGTPKLPISFFASVIVLAKLYFVYSH